MNSCGRTILRIRFGSHLYGTATPASDLDVKSIFVPRAKDILLGRVKGSISTKRPKAEGEKNYAGEVDEEAYALQRFLGLVAEGQTVATDVLFAPDWALIDTPGPEWREIVANRSRLVTRKSNAFIGYCMRQASKYGIKGSRVATTRFVYEILRNALAEHPPTAKLEAIRDVIEYHLATNKPEYFDVIEIETTSGVKVPHLEVCGRKMPYTASIKSAFDIIKQLVAKSGERARMAAENDGVDWKALSHAVRVATQGIELLQTGAIRFPRPNAAHLLDIKLGRLRYAEVASEIEGLLPAAQEASDKSHLADDVDRTWIDEFVVRVYGLEAIAAGGSQSWSRKQNGCGD